MIKFKLLFLFLFGLLLIAGCKEDDPEAENLAPTTFDLLYVADRESDVTLTPMLTWEQSSSSLNPVRYSLLMDKKQDLEDQGLTEPVTEVAKGLENNYFQFENYLDVITEYHWYVVASDADGNTTRSSSTYTFVTTIDTLDPPDSFKLLLPIDGFIDAPLKPSLSWEKATDPNNIPVIYDVYFGKNANPTSLYQQYVIGTSITIPTDLDFETTYFWKVVAKNIKGATTASTTFSFTTRPDLNNIITSATKKTSSGLDSLYGGIYGHQVVEFNGSLYMLGGNDLGNSNAVFKSTDGWNWDLIKPHNSDEPFFPSDELQAVVFKNQIWVFDGTRNTIRNSSDGIIWNNVTVSGSVIDGSHWKGKHGHQVVVFDGRIFVIGGTNAGIPTNDVWSSDNGVDWEYDTNQDYIFPRRIGHACVVHKGRMYVVGGSSDGVLQNDVWSTANGLYWFKDTANAAFDPRIEHTITSAYHPILRRQLMFLVGGRSGTDRAETWVSINGKEWIEAKYAIPADFVGRSEHQCILYKGQFFVFFGKKSALGLEDIWTLDY